MTEPIRSGIGLLLSARLARLNMTALSLKASVAGTWVDNGDASTAGDVWSHPSGRRRKASPSNSTDGRPLVILSEGCDRVAEQRRTRRHLHSLAKTFAFVA